MSYDFIRRMIERKHYMREQTARILQHRRQCPQAPPLFRDVVAHEFLFATAKELKAEGNEKAPGPDEVRFADVSVAELAGITRDLHKLLVAGEWQPSTARESKIPKKKSGDFRVLKIRSIATQIIAGAVHRWLSPYMETIYLPISYGFRSGRGIQDMWLELERRMVQGNAWCIVQDDIRKAFDNVNINLVMEDHARHITDLRLLSLIRQLLEGHPSEQRQTGIDQGLATSPGALNTHLHYRLDLPLTAAVPSGMPRFADNVVDPAMSVPGGQETMGKANELLGEVGLELKGEDAPANLSLGETAEVLGMRLAVQSSQLRYQLGSNAWERLQEALEEAAETNNPTSSTSHVIQGWVAAYGPALAVVRRQPLVDRILAEAAELGITEVSSDTVSTALQGAGDKWLAFRAKHGLGKAG
jgi:hypothetical protein